MTTYMLCVIFQATASVDPETDTFLTEMIAKLFKNVTTITIAHRLQTIMRADQILVIDKGVVAEQGPSNPRTFTSLVLLDCFFACNLLSVFFLPRLAISIVFAGSPAELLRKEGHFTDMVDGTGEESKRALRALASPRLPRWLPARFFSLS